MPPGAADGVRACLREQGYSGEGREDGEGDDVSREGARYHVEKSSRRSPGAAGPGEGSYGACWHGPDGSYGLKGGAWGTWAGAWGTWAGGGGGGVSAAPVLTLTMGSWSVSRL